MNKQMKISLYDQINLFYIKEPNVYGFLKNKCKKLKKTNKARLIHNTYFWCVFFSWFPYHINPVQMMAASKVYLMR